MSAGPWGTDLAMVSVGGVLDLSWGEVGGVDLVVQRALRRLSTVRGGLRGRPSEGIDLRSLVRSGVLVGTPGSIAAQVKSTLLADEAILTADVGVTWTLATSTLTITAALTLTTGPLTMTFALSPDSVAVVVNGLPASWSTN